jgi:hypothetical protein
MGSLERRCRAEWRRIADDQAAHLLWGSPRRIGRRHWPEVCLIDRHFVVLAGPFAYVVSPGRYHDCAPGRTGVSA